jgi:hypothetical protein
MADIKERQERAVAMLKALLNGPDINLPEPPALPAQATEVDRVLESRIARLEEQERFLVKVVWRTSAAVIGAVVAGPTREILLALVRTWLGGQ